MTTPHAESRQIRKQPDGHLAQYMPEVDSDLPWASTDGHSYTDEQAESWSLARLAPPSAEAERWSEHHARDSGERLFKVAQYLGLVAGYAQAAAGAAASGNVGLVERELKPIDDTLAGARAYLNQAFAERATATTWSNHVDPSVPWRAVYGTQIHAWAADAFRRRQEAAFELHEGTDYLVPVVVTGTSHVVALCYGNIEAEQLATLINDEIGEKLVERCDFPALVVTPPNATAALPLLARETATLARLPRRSPAVTSVS